VDTASQRPGVLFLDDIQWADRATLDLLTYMARRLGEFPLCLLLTWRNIEVPNSPRLNRLVAESERTGHATVLPLSRLSLAGIRALAGSSGTPPAETEKVSERLYEETEGLPLFLVEYLSAIAGGARSGSAPEWSLPGGIRELLHLRLQAVGESSWQILTTAAVIGRSFDFATLWGASGRSEEETVAALEDLISQGLVVEVSRAGDNEPAYDFTHEKLRALVYEETSLARRRLLHRRVAESLAGRTHRLRQSRSLPGQIARHFLQAGAESEAAEYFKVAGERARAVYANTEALEHFSTALALGHPDAAGLHEAIGDLYTFLGTYGSALKSYETAAALSPAEKLATLEQKLGGVYLRRGDWELAESHFQAALEASEASEASETPADEEKPAGSDGQKARIYADWSLAARNRGQFDLALRLAVTALQLATLAHDTEAEAQAHNMLGILATGQGRFDEAVRQLEESLELAASVPDRDSARAAALNNLALTLGAIGDEERAISLAEEALGLCVAQGDRHREAALHNNIADLLHAAGRSPEAMAHIKESVAIYAEIGVEAGTVQPQIWKLAEW
jgi:tetratricopeptide (TPR) repeat protein